MREKSGTPRLRAEDLCVRFGDFIALRPVSFALDAGEVLSVHGATGSGKTTLARCLLGLQPEIAIVGGGVFFHGRELRGLSAREWREIRGRRIAMVSQEPALALNPYLTIRRQLREYCAAHSRRAETERQAADNLERLAPGILGRLPHQLSGGERQRAALALAAIHRPEILIADEPTTAVDSITERLVLDFLLDLQRASDMSLIAISHRRAVHRYLNGRVLKIEGR